jgi:MOSC domain-containing protein YiiM
VREGELGAGDPVAVGPRPAHGITVRTVSEAILHDEMLMGAATAPELAASLADWMRERAG